MILHYHAKPCLEVPTTQESSQITPDITLLRVYLRWQLNDNDEVHRTKRTRAMRYLRRSKDLVLCRVGGQATIVVYLLSSTLIRLRCGLQIAMVSLYAPTKPLERHREYGSVS